jgi:surfeit locus 1 family protein
MPAGYSFRPRLWGLALAALACAGGIALGHWQAGRADEKRAAGARSERVSVAGTFLPQHTVLLDNKLRHGQPGYEVVTPLRLQASGEHVLVNRGWIAAPRTRAELPQVRTPAGAVQVEGVEARFPRILALEREEKGRVRQTVEVKKFAVETGLRLQARLIEQHSPLDDGLLREWSRPDAGVEKHESYALQWYSLAVLAAILGVVLSFRKA